MFKEMAMDSENRSNNGSNYGISPSTQFSTCNHCFGRGDKNSKHREKKARVEEIKNTEEACEVLNLSDIVELDTERNSILQTGSSQDCKRRFSISPIKSNVSSNVSTNLSKELRVSPLYKKLPRSHRMKITNSNKSCFEKSKRCEMSNLNNSQPCEFSTMKISARKNITSFRWSLAPSNFMKTLESTKDIDCPRSMKGKWTSQREFYKPNFNIQIKNSFCYDLAESKPSSKIAIGTINHSNNDAEALESFVQKFKGMKNQNRFVFKNCLGEGTFGKVIECVDLKRKRILVAIKISKKIFSGGDTEMQEVNILKLIQEKDPSQLNHCATLLQVLKIENRPCLIFRRYGDNLYSWMKKRKFEPLPQEVIYQITCQLFHACMFLHDICEIIHTDLKPENIVFTSPIYIFKEERGGKRNILPSRVDIKIIDFGNAVKRRQKKYKQGIGTRHYRSIEIILGQEWDEKVDIWSIGCILYELYTGHVLFEAKNDAFHLAMIDKIIGPTESDMVKTSKMSHLFMEDGRFYRNAINEYYLIDQMSSIKFHFKHPSYQSQMFTKIIISCLKIDPKERPHCKEILQLSFFQMLSGLRKKYKLFNNSL